MLVAFSVTPSGTATTSVSEGVAEAVRIVRDSGLPNRTDSMFTTIEGEWDEVMAVVRQAMLAASMGTGRVSLVLKADDRTDQHGTMDSKIAAVERRLQA